MIGYRLATFALFFTIPLFGCSGITGTGTYVNKHYKDKPKSNVRLAIAPLTRLGPPLPCSSEARKCPPLIPLIDNVFAKVFGRFSNKVTIIPMTKARRYFEANQDVLNKLVDTKYSEEDLSRDPSLTAIFDNKQLASLREELDTADLLLVPARFDLVPKFGRTFGYSEFRLYDLGSGSMIFTSSRNMNINIGDEEGRGLMAGALIDRSTSDFEELYLNK